MIDLRCHSLIRALDGGFVFKQSQGCVLPVPREDDHAAVMNALLTALAAPALVMTSSERSRIMGPKVLAPFD